MRRLFAATLILLATSIHAVEFHFVNARLITMEENGFADGELLVRGEEIAALGATVTPGPEAIRIDVKGGYLMPGLSEMHAHVPGSRQGIGYRDDVLFLYVANGITTVRGMLGDASHLKLRETLSRHEIVGPRLVTSGPSFNGNSVSSPAQAERMVREQASAGYDFLKIHPGVPRDAYDAIAETANELGIAFAGHVPADVGLLHALESGQATIDHLDGYVQALVPNPADAGGGLFALDLLPQVDDSRIDVVVAATRDAGAWVVPTETLLENFAAAANINSIDARPQNAYLPRSVRSRYRQALSGNTIDAAAASRYLDLRKRIIRELHAAGVGILLGSDAPQIFNVPGFSAHRELASYVAAGLSPFEALKTGTVNPARYFGREDESGTLSPGKSADIIWLSANPLTDIANTQSIQGVMLRGEWLDRLTLDAGLAKIAADHAD